MEQPVMKHKKVSSLASIYGPDGNLVFGVEKYKDTGHGYRLQATCWPKGNGGGGPLISQALDGAFLKLLKRAMIGIINDGVPGSSNNVLYMKRVKGQREPVPTNNWVIGINENKRVFIEITQMTKDVKPLEFIFLGIIHDMGEGLTPDEKSLIQAQLFCDEIDSVLIPTSNACRLDYISPKPPQSSYNNNRGGNGGGNYNKNRGGGNYNGGGNKNNNNNSDEDWG
jgi:hypothetical protein